MSNVPPSPQSAPAEQRSWIARHKILTALGVLLLVVVVGGVIAAWPVIQLRLSSQYAAALETVRHSPKVVERLGEPIKTVFLSLSGNVGERESRIRFDVAGPKGTAKVFAFARLMKGQWDFSQLEVEFPDKQHVDLAQDIAGTDDTPKFDPNAKQSEAQQPDMPVDIALPDLPAEPEPGKK